jgi:hypothetical protein
LVALPNWAADDPVAMIDAPSLTCGRLAWITLKTLTRSVSMVSDHDWMV